MPQFIYKAKENPQKTVEGIVEAENSDQASRKVIALGFVPTEVALFKKSERQPKEGARPSSFVFLKHIPDSAIVLFTRQMSDLVEASVPLLRALHLVHNQIKNQYFKKIVHDLYSQVKDGESLSGALARHPAVFPKLYVNMVKSGEVSGKLSIILNRLADLSEKEQETKNKIKSSLAYPLLVLIVGVISIGILLAVVIPRITLLYDDFNQMLPLPTIILIRLSEFFVRYGWLVTVVLVVILVYVRKLLSSPPGRMRLDSAKLKMPLLGRFIKDVEVGRFSRVLGTLLESGVVIVTALNLVWAVLENEVLKAEIKKVAEEVNNGASLTVALKTCSYFSEMAIHMVAVGEETGNLEKGLYKLADTCEREASDTARMFTTLLGPVVLIFIVAFVGFIVVSLLLPILRMNLIVM
ncbi:MAG: type II secretion system F family protein [Candidatus Omnitrophota bacterium]